MYNFKKLFSPNSINTHLYGAASLFVLSFEKYLLALETFNNPEMEFATNLNNLWDNITHIQGIVSFLSRAA